jgi:hypothetical protein
MTSPRRRKAAITLTAAGAASLAALLTTIDEFLRSSPAVTVGLAVQFDEHYLSPVHEHGDYWVVACAYRGADRWDMDKRLDDGSVDGHAELEMVDQILLTPGMTTAMPPPSRAVHSHNNVFSGATLELIFTAADPLPAHERLLHNPDMNSCARLGSTPRERWLADGTRSRRRTIAVLACPDSGRAKTVYYGRTVLRSALRAACQGADSGGAGVCPRALPCPGLVRAKVPGVLPPVQRLNARVRLAASA